MRFILTKTVTAIDSSRRPFVLVAGDVVEYLGGANGSVFLLRENKSYIVTIKEWKGSYRVLLN